MTPRKLVQPSARHRHSRSCSSSPAIATLGHSPNMLLNTRERWAVSAKPASSDSESFPSRSCIAGEVWSAASSSREERGQTPAVSVPAWELGLSFSSGTLVASPSTVSLMDYSDPSTHCAREFPASAQVGLISKEGSMRRRRLGSDPSDTLSAAQSERALRGPAEGESLGKRCAVGVFLASASKHVLDGRAPGRKDVRRSTRTSSSTVFDGQFNTQKQVNQLRDALISKKFDAWYIGPNDGGPLTPTIKQAIEGRASRSAARSCRAGPTSATRRLRSPARRSSPASASTRTGSCSEARGAGLHRATTRARWRGCRACLTLPLEKARTDGLFSIIEEDKNDQGRLHARPAATSPRRR